MTKQISMKPWKYFCCWDATQSDKIIMKNVDDTTKNSLKISKLFRYLLSNGFLLPIYIEYIWFTKHVKTKIYEEYLLGTKKQDARIIILRI